MQLSSRQRKWLKLNKRFEDDPPTTLKLISLSGVALVAPAMACAMGVAIAAALEIVDMHFVMFIAGMALGAFARDCGRLRLVSHLWPVVHHVMDWHKVNELLTEDAQTETKLRI